MADGGGPGSGPVTGDEPANGSARTDVRSDAELLVVVRGRPADQASSLAFAALYDRHRDAARGLARQLARSPADADDLVSAAFARLLEILRAGGGPTEAFRAYLLTSLRHLAYDRTRAERRLDLTEDMGEVIGVDPERTVVPFTDPAVAGLERSLAARAFATLPERWQAVLWHLEVEGDSPADIAPLFGLTANAVSALGYRAREGLRQAYLQMHLSGAARAECRPAAAKLGAYVRGGLAKRDAAPVAAHLDQCAECRRVFAELGDVNVALKGIVAPIVLGPAAVAYLASAAGKGSAGAWIAGRLGWFRRAPKGQQAVAAGVAAAAVVGLAAAALALTGHSGPAPASAHRGLPPAAAGAPAASTSPGPSVGRSGGSTGG